MSQKTIEICLKKNYFSATWPCTVCGGVTKDVVVVAESDPPNVIRVCEGCLKRNQIDKTLEKHAAWLENYARHIRSLIGRLKVPTYQEWEKRSDDHVVELQAQEISHRGEWRKHLMYHDRTGLSDDMPF